MTTQPPGRAGVPALSFDRLTPLYDAFVRLVGFGPPFTERVLDAAAVRDGETILDVGAGTGSLLVLAKRRHPRSRAIGVDPDRRVLRIARAKLERSGVAAELLRAGAEAIPLPPSSVDVAVSGLVFHHLPIETKTAAIAEVSRVLRPGGRFLLADFGPPDTAFLRAAFALVRALRLPEAATLEDNVKGRLPGLHEAAGFRVREAAPRYRGVRFLEATLA